MKIRKCQNCSKEFETETKRLTCSRSCAVALSWKNPKSAASRKIGISKSKKTPEAIRQLAEHNERRWSRPGEREKLSEQNRREWANPRKRAKRSAGIKRAHGTPEKRYFYSRMREEQWANDPEYRRKTLAGMRHRFDSPEFKLMFSNLLRERWLDPIMRAKYTDGIKRSHSTPEAKARQSAIMIKRWRDDEAFRALVAASMEVYWSKPETRDYHAQMMRDLWSDPIWRLKQLDLMNQARPTVGATSKNIAAASDLMAQVDAVIPRGLPDFMRMDIASDLTLALLEGDLKIANLKSEAKKYLTAHRKMFPDKWGPVSIDAPLPGTDGFTIADTLSNDSPHF